MKNSWMTNGVVSCQQPKGSKTEKDCATITSDWKRQGVKWNFEVKLQKKHRNLIGNFTIFS